MHGQRIPELCAGRQEISPRFDLLYKSLFTWCSTPNRVRPAAVVLVTSFLNHLADNCPKPLHGSFGNRTTTRAGIPELREVLNIVVPFSCRARGRSMQKPISASGLYSKVSISTPSTPFEGTSSDASGCNSASYEFILLRSQRGGRGSNPLSSTRFKTILACAR